MLLLCHTTHRHHESMGSDSDGVDYESLAAAVLAVVIVALTTLTRQLASSGTTCLVEDQGSRRVGENLDRS